jgi:hypothetical protein
MAKSKLRVRHLTLPLSNVLVAEDRSFQVDVEEVESLLLLEKERQRV